MDKRFYLLIVSVLLSSCQWLPEVENVSLSAQYMSVAIGEERIVVATVKPKAANYDQIQWVSSNPSVASVSDGVVKGKATGSTVITAIVSGVQSPPLRVTVVRK